MASSAASMTLEPFFECELITSYNNENSVWLTRQHLTTNVKSYSEQLIILLIGQTLQKPVKVPVTR